MDRKIGIVMVVHGSRQAEANEMTEQFVVQVRELLNTDCLEVAFMEHAEPNVPQAIERLLARGCNDLYGFLLFLAPGAHSSRDIPALFERTLRNHPGVQWKLSPPLLQQRAMLEFVAARLQCVLRSLPARSDALTMLGGS